MVVYVSMSQMGYRSLEGLLGAGKRIDLIVTLPPDVALSAAGYADFGPLALRWGVPVVTPRHIGALLGEFQLKRPTAIIVNGWSQILKPELMATAIHGCVGTHPALLPRNRGRAPIPWHFINEEEFGGLTLFYLDEGVDSGPIIDQCRFRTDTGDNARTYYEKSTRCAEELLLKHYDGIVTGTAPRRFQDHADATYLLKRTEKDSFLDFTGSVRRLCNLVRAVFDIYPLAFFRYRGRTYRIGGAEQYHGPRYFGRPGQIARATEGELLVLAGDGIMVLADLRNEAGHVVVPRDVFRAGEVVNE